MSDSFIRCECHFGNVESIDSGALDSRSKVCSSATTYAGGQIVGMVRQKCVVIVQHS